MLNDLKILSLISTIFVILYNTALWQCPLKKIRWNKKSKCFKLGHTKRTEKCKVFFKVPWKSSVKTGFKCVLAHGHVHVWFSFVLSPTFLRGSNYLSAYFFVFRLMYIYFLKYLIRVSANIHRLLHAKLKSDCSMLFLQRLTLFQRRRISINFQRCHFVNK